MIPPQKASTPAAHFHLESSQYKESPLQRRDPGRRKDVAAVWNRHMHIMLLLEKLRVRRA
jgi:hypothetical protein